MLQHHVKIAFKVAQHAIVVLVVQHVLHIILHLVLMNIVFQIALLLNNIGMQQ